MFARLSLAIAALVIVVACGGGSAATPAPSLAPGQTPAPQATVAPPPPQAGEDITGEEVQAAVDALANLDSWTFEATYWLGGGPIGIETSVAGIERNSPDEAVDAMHTSANGNFRYIRIGDDIWTDVGTGGFFHSNAPDVPNLVEQYEPSYIDALVDAANGSVIDFEYVGVESVNGINAVHYTLSENDRENAVQLLDIEPALFAGDAWIAAEGYLVALAWGPQSVETAQVTQGFRYDVTSVDCTCPIEPPD